MPAYTITAVADKTRDWNSNRDGAMKSYRVTLRNDRGAEMPNVEVSYKATDPVPQPGQLLNDVTVDTSGSYGPKVVFPRKFGAGGGGGRAKPVEERRSIAMQSSNQRGVDIVRLAVEAGWKCNNIDELTAQALRVADAFFQRVMKAEAGS